MQAAAAKRDIVTIGGSAGAIDVVKTIVRSLPADFGAAVFIIVHTSPRLPSHMPDILNRVGPLHVCHAAEGDAIVPGQIYLAPPDRHLIVAENHIHISRGPREGLHRPSINMTFRSAAGAYHERVVGVLLSGMLDDGASGLWEIARHGGVMVVQNRAEAQFPSMPLSALHDVPVDYEARAEEIGPLLNGLVSGANIYEIRPKINGPESPELFSGLTCPECRGPLWNRKGGPAEFHCRVGHIFSIKALIDEHTSTQERKLYEALVSLEEGATLTEYATHHVEEPHREALQKEAGQLRQHASAIRRLLDERVIAPLS